MKALQLFFILLLFSMAGCNNHPAPDPQIVISTPAPIKKDSLASSLSAQSEITCPKCGYKKMEMLPTEICLLKYTCVNCNEILFPKEGDCCVFCTYGTVKCPSMQE